MRANIRISVALVTRNRPDSLQRTLRSLRGQSVQPLEVMISDDSEEIFADKVLRVAEKYEASYIRGPRRGLYANRNSAVSACKGTHVRTMDDDHEFPDGHFEKCLSAIQSDPESIWIVGEYLATDEIATKPPHCPGQLHARGFSVLPPNPDNCWAISDGASIFPKAIFDRGLGYRDDFKFGYAYLELGSRLHWLGYRVRHLAGTYVVHHFDPEARSFMDPQIELSSRIFSMLCHSFIYQRAMKNRFLCCAEIIRALINMGDIALPPISQAFHAYRRQLRELARTENGIH